MMLQGKENPLSVVHKVCNTYLLMQTTMYIYTMLHIFIFCTVTTMAIKVIIYTVQIYNTLAILLCKL